LLLGAIIVVVPRKAKAAETLGLVLSLWRMHAYALGSKIPNGRIMKKTRPTASCGGGLRSAPDSSEEEGVRPKGENTRQGLVSKL